MEGIKIVSKEFQDSNRSLVSIGPSVKPINKIETPIVKAMHDHISHIDIDKCTTEDLNSFYICNLGELTTLVKLWNRMLPRVKLYYAVKCNNNPVLLQRMATLGLGFDCASMSEISTILKYGISTERIIYANPCKIIPHIRYAKSRNIPLTTVDSIDELLKMNKYYPECNVLIRIRTHDSTSVCSLSVKFGVSVEYAKQMVDICSELNLNLVGISFHVGSGCKFFKSFDFAVKDSKELFDYAEKQKLHLDVLDVGGGFCKETFYRSSRTLKESLDRYFPPTSYPSLKIISEVGRFLASSCFTLAVNVIAKRSGEKMDCIYLNDGVYGNLNCIIYDHQKVVPRVLTSNGQLVYQNHDNHIHKSCSIWGPTCDGLDCICSQCELQYDVEIGDWIYFESTGAYTSVACTSFNGFNERSKCFYIDV